MGNPRLQLSLNATRLSSVINTAVVSTNEIVNFHFDALDGADLAQPSPCTEKFRVRGQEMTAAERRALHENWILSKAFQDLLRAVRHALEDAFVFGALLTKTHQVKSNATLAEFIAPFQAKASAMKFPELLDAVNCKLTSKIEFSQAYMSLQTARNCLEHRAGVITKIETHQRDEFVLRVPRVKMFYIRNGEEIELEPGHTVDPGDDRAEVDTFAKFEIRARSFSIGQRLSFTKAQFNEIAFACYLLGQQLATRLPKPEIL
ncbi:MAG TPA: hypothetical protein VFL51_01760 [Pseudolabrys sp.]|nr:hypothetical protein [Pseudolabrys sp.]